MLDEEAIEDFKTYLQSKKSKKHEGGCYIQRIKTLNYILLMDIRAVKLTEREMIK